MKLIFLGSGSAFTIGADNYQSNMLLVDERNNKLLIDCGSDIRFSLHALAYSHQDITDIYISHLHGDHVGGLEYVGFSTKFDARCPTPRLYLSEELADDLWEHTLSGGMRSIQGDTATLDTYFDVQKVQSSSYFFWEKTRFDLVPTIHIRGKKTIVPSYGLFFEVDRTKVFLTTDSQFCPDVIGDYLDQADIIFHDCETSPFKSTVHAHYEDLVTLPTAIKNKMWLYHYQRGKLPNAQKDGFCGFVKRGQVFDFARLETLRGRQKMMSLLPQGRLK
ncbi:MBL fold metallo-hydrolase [Phormidesmis sp. 146-35]